MDTPTSTRSAAATVYKIPQEHYLNSTYGIRSWLLTTDHKRIALLYLFSVTFFFFVGGILATMIRIHLLTPQGFLVTPETYNKLFTMHGVAMVFFFLIPSIPAVLGNFLVPLMVGAKDLAFPKINLLSWYIYMLGGFTGYLGETLKGSASFQAMLKAYDGGAVITGSSAGAMVMCQYYFDPGKGHVVEGLGLVPNSCVLPHHNTFGKGWANRLSTLLPGAVLLGIDERTGMLDDGDAGRKRGWRVYGQGVVTLYRGGHATVYQTGEAFEDDFAL